MKRFLCFSLVLGAAVALGWFFLRAFGEGPARADGAVAGEQGQGGGVVSGNGDVNGDNGLDLSDAIYLLAFLFQGGDPPEPCPGGGGNCTVCEEALATCQADLLDCLNAESEICNDGIDNDLDCLTDCADSDCDTDIDCTVVTPTFTEGLMNAEGYRTFTDDAFGIEFVLLPGATGTEFQMGSPDTEPGHLLIEGPVHAVTLDPFLISKTEVTQAQYVAVMGTNPSLFLGNPLPVENVSWDMLHAAGGFLQKTGLQLPSEAQWEYAARGGTQTAFSFGDDCNTTSCGDLCAPAEDFMWWCANAGDTTHPVAQKQPNPFGLFDMHGNVWERLEDVYDAEFYGKPEAAGPNPVATSGTGVVIRGGGYRDFPQFCRSARRGPGTETSQSADTGFRVAATLP